MSRREFLRAGIVAVTAGIAGCGSLSGESSGSEYELTASDHLAVAVGNLNVVALAVREFQNAENPREVGFEEAGPRERIGTARTAIDEAERADGSADVEAVRTYADLVESMIDAVVNMLDASEGLEETETVLDADDPDVDAASAILDDAREASEAAVTARDAALAASDGADGDRLAALDAEFEAVRDGVDALSAYVTGVDGLTLGYDSHVDGIDRLQTADDRADVDEYDAARSSFEAAAGDFEASSVAFADAIPDSPDDLVDELDLGNQRSVSLERLSTGYVDLLDGREEVAAAETAMEDDEDDEARRSLAEGKASAETAMTTFDEGDEALEDEFTERFREARNRATAMVSMSDGYTHLLDGRDHVETAETRIEDDEHDGARASLEAAEDESAAADEAFAAGQEAAGDLFDEEFETARIRASSLGSLSGGYVELLDANDHVRDGESALFDEAYDDAEAAFDRGAAESRNAGATFEDGAETGGELFEEEFDRAARRATALEALSDGYGTMVGGRRDLEAGREAFDDGSYDEAGDRFEAADGTFANAESTFEENRDDAGSEFDGEFDRALCQSGHLRAATDYFVSATDAARQGDTATAEAERDRGEEELEAAEEC